MITVSNDELIAAAEAVLHPHRVGDRLFGNVGSTLVTDAGNLYSGVCIDTGSGTGFCAEHSAIAAMVTAREYRIAKVVAVWRNDEGALHVLLRAAGAGSSSARSTRRTWMQKWSWDATRRRGSATSCPPMSGLTRWTDL